MRNLGLVLLMLWATRVEAVRQPFFALFAQHVQRVGFVVQKPTFTGELQHYGKLYRGTSWCLGVAAAAYLPVYTRVFALGVGFGLDWYQDGGVAARVEGGTVRRDEEEETRLTFVPARVLLLTALKPLGEWVSLDLGIGLEYLYGQELRVGSGDMENDSPLLNRAWHPYGVMQAGIGVSLRGLEKRAMRALQRGFDITNVYLSLQLRRAELLRSRGPDFSRRSYALGITFEAG